MVEEGAIKATSDITTMNLKAADAGNKESKKLSKRQRRKQPNDKNKWPQHPKIQSMDVRHKAYVRVAGINAKVKETIDPKLDLMSPEVKFGRLLGGTDQRKRHAAVNKLKAYLKARCDVNNEDGGISEMDLLKLWKGLWFTLYMADKVPVQDELSKRLAELLWCVTGTEEEDEYAGQAYLQMCEEEELDEDEEDVTMEEVFNSLNDGVEKEDSEESDVEEADDDEESDSENDSNEEGDSDDGGSERDEFSKEEEDVDEGEDSIDESKIPHCRGAHLASLFIRTFFRTIRREWGNMDKYRVDKFYTLTRLYVHEIFKYMATRHWNLGIIRLFNDAMFEEVLSKTPNGLRYHLIDIALEELAKVNAKAPMPLTEATFLDTMEPYFAMCQTGANDDSVQNRVMDKVLERFLEEYSVVSDSALEQEEGEKEKEDSVIMDQVHVGTVAQFIFELASDSETKDQYRKSLYEMHKKFMRRLKKIGKDVDINQEDDNEGELGEDDENVRQQVIDFRDAMGEYQGSTEVIEASNKKQQTKIIEESNDESLVNTKEEKRKKRKKNTKAAKEERELPIKETDDRPKKKKREVTSVEADEESGDDEEIVTISLSEQKRAKKESKKKKKRKDMLTIEEGTDERTQGSNPKIGGKRVKFGTTNRSKSYKASMKALVTSNVPNTSESTPEKGILLNKGKIRQAGVTKRGGRKKAINYF